MKTTKNLAEIAIGEIFEVAEIKFIKFAEKNGQTIAVAKDTLFTSSFGKDNNFSKSIIKRRLENEILPNIEAEVGEENIVEHEVDLLSLDGDDKHGKINCKISIPTFDFYRHNVKMFDKYKLDAWWWLANPDSTSAHCNDNWSVCVSPRGNVYCNGFFNFFGVRPFIVFVSSISVIFVSCEE